MILVCLIILVATLVTLILFHSTQETFYDTVTTSSVIPYRCDSDSALFFDRKYTCYPQGSQLVDACNTQLKSKFPNSSHVYTKGKCLDDTHSQWDDPIHKVANNNYNALQILAQLAQMDVN